MYKFSILLCCLAGVFIGIATSGGGVAGLVLGLAGGTLCCFSGALLATHFAEEGKL